jgi:hypothetical protein
VDFGLVAAKEISDHRGDAGDMNMQLVLAAASRRINCHSDLVTQQSVPRPFLNEAAGVPCGRPIVWRIFAVQRRAFNTRNTSGWNDDYMRAEGAWSTTKPRSRPLAILTSAQGNATPMLR